MQVMVKIGNQKEILQGDSTKNFFFITFFFLFYRRFDPYTRPCTVLASLFAIGLVLIIIVVLSLIPLYISHKSSTSSNNNIQTSGKYFISN